MKLNSVGTVLLGTTMFLFCSGTVADHNHYNVYHNCELDSHNGAWSGMGLELYHDDDRSCPQDAQPTVTTIESGGIVDFPGAWYPTINPGGIQYPTELIVSAYQAQIGCQTLGSEMDRSESYFAFYDYIGGSPNGNGADGNPDWAAGAWVSFVAGTGSDPNRDCIQFQAIKGVHPSTNGVGVMVVNYTSR